MRIQGVVLEYHSDVAILRSDVVAQPAVNIQLALGDILQAGNHAQRGGLSAAGRADQNDKFLIGDLQIHIINRQNIAVIDLFQIFQHNLRHKLLL